MPRPPRTEHHWLSILVARPGPAEPMPVTQARVTIRPYPRNATRPSEPIARGTTAADGTLSLLLPPGRYAVSARHGNEGRAVTITLEHAGRARLMLENITKRVTLTAEVSRQDGRALPEALIEIRTVPAGTLATSAVTDERGIAHIRIPPGAYEIRVGQTLTKTYLETDTLLRITAETTPTREPASLTRYAQKARHATSYTAPFDVKHMRDDVWN